MREWRTATVLELQTEAVLLVEDGNHGEYRPRPDEFVDDGVAFIRAVDMDDGRVLFASASRINETARRRITKGIGAGGDVLLSHKGTVGKVALVPDDSPPFVCSPQTTFWRTLMPEVLDRRYLHAFLRSPGFHQQLRARSGETDMAPYVSLTAQRGLIVTIPPIEIQRFIADAIGSLDDKIELNRKMNETLEAMARVLFKSWFVDFDPVRAKMAGRALKGMDAAMAALFPDRLEGGIPRGWANIELAEATALGHGEVQTGPFGSQLHASDYVPHGIPVVMPTNIRERRIDASGIARVTPADADRLSRHRLRVGDLVYSRRGDVEKHAIVGPEEAGWLCGTGCLRVRSSADGQVGVSSHFLSLWLDQPAAREWISARAIGATMPNLNTTILGEVPVLLPTREVAHAFDQLVIPIDSRVRLARAESEALVELRDMLLPRLLSGELRIRDAEREVEKVA